MTINLSDIRIGSKVIVRPCFGVGEPILVTVTKIDNNIKNNCAGITYGDETYDFHWAYIDQIDSIVSF